MQSFRARDTIFDDFCDTNDAPNANFWVRPWDELNLGRPIRNNYTESFVVKVKSTSVKKLSKDKNLSTGFISSGIKTESP